MGSRIINHQREQKKIKKHVKKVKPEILTEFGLVFSPRFPPFQGKKEQRNQYQPIKIIVPGGMRYLIK